MTSFFELWNLNEWRFTLLFSYDYDSTCNIPQPSNPPFLAAAWQSRPSSCASHLPPFWARVWSSSVGCCMAWWLLAKSEYIFPLRVSGQGYYCMSVVCVVLVQVFSAASFTLRYLSVYSHRLFLGWMWWMFMYCLVCSVSLDVQVRLKGRRNFI